METTKSKTPGHRILRSDSPLLATGNKVTIGPQPGMKSECSTTNQPTVELKRDAQGNDTIEVVCACGERIIIRCDYAA